MDSLSPFLLYGLFATVTIAVILVLQRGMLKTTLLFFGFVFSLRMLWYSMLCCVASLERWMIEVHASLFNKGPFRRYFSFSFSR